MYKYWGFGLKIVSAIKFPELRTFDFEVPDVEYVLDSVPDAIEGNTISAKLFSYTINEHELLFVTYGVARYYATDGNKVIISPEKPVEDWRSVRLYVLATIMAAILLHRNMLPLHASAIKQGAFLTLIAGDSRAGKSTSLAGLLKRGYSIFSDDVVVLQEKQKQFLAKASYPMVKLWEDTLRKMNNPMFEDYSFPIQKGLNKYGFFFHDKFDRNSYPVTKVFVLKIGEVSELTSKKLEGKHAFAALIRQIYRPMLMQTNRQRLLCFTMITDIVKKGSVIEISRPQECNPDNLVNFIESLL